jgi:hypothetical protein
MFSQWRTWRGDSALYVLALDERVLRSLKKRTVNLTWDEAHRLPDFGRPRNTCLHLGLLPQPFCGEFGNAPIYALMLNPGIGWQDNYGEYNVSEYRQALLRRRARTAQRTKSHSTFCNHVFRGMADSAGGTASSYGLSRRSPSLGKPH